MYEFTGDYQERLAASKKSESSDSVDKQEFCPWQYPDLDAPIDHAEATTTVLVK